MVVRYRSAVADPQLVGQIVAAGITALASGGAAFLGSRSANRNTDVEDKRAKEIAAAEAERAERAAEWDRIHRMVTMACSTNQTESYVGMDLLEKSRTDWNDNPEQRKFIRQPH